MSKRSLKPWAFAASVLLPIGVQAAGQGLLPAATEEIMAGARSCAAATAAAGVDVRTLESNGWRKASMTDKDGKPSATPMTFYGKGHLLLMFNKVGAKPLCIVTARISSTADFPKLQAAFASTFGTAVEDDGKGEQIFIAPDHRFVALASTGTIERPSVRVVVGPVFQEKK